MRSERLIPSMFHRRLLLLFGGVVLLWLPLAGQLFRLSILQHDTLSGQAESKLIRKQWTPTVRGRILDRKGRVLAQDRPSYDAGVDYRVLAGLWADDRAWKFARRAYRAEWPKLTEERRRELADKVRPAYVAHLERAWNDLSTVIQIDRTDLDRRRREIVAKVERRREAVIARKREQELEEARARGSELTPQLWQTIQKRTDIATREQSISHPIAPRLTDAVGFLLQGLAEEIVELRPLEGTTDDAPELIDRVERFPGVRVIDTGDREYPFESVTVPIDRSSLPSPLRGVPAAEDGIVDPTAPDIADVRVTGVANHVLGWIRDEVFAEDAQARRDVLDAQPALKSRVMFDGVDRGEYLEGDRVGHSGIEATREIQLRGLRGLRRLQLDTGQETFTPAEPGRDLKLAMDVMLQARVQAAMSKELGLSVVQPWHGAITTEGDVQMGPVPIGTELHGAAVVLDVDTGDILAMVSTPTFTREALRDRPETVFEDSINFPFMNRAIAKPYPPGSIVKAIVLASAVNRGVYSLDQRIECTGHFFPNRPLEFRCWIYKRAFTTHSAQLEHDLSAPEALMVSCNIFFYTMGQRLGPAGIAATYRDYGVGTPFNLGLGIEYPGTVGQKNDGSDLTIQDAIFMGIGQGPVAWTPLHAAAAYATLARGGVVLPPRIVADDPRATPRELSLNPAGVSAALEGLRLSVNNTKGTGNHITIAGRDELIFNVPDVTVWGKTGTAQAPPVRYDPDGDGPLPARTVIEGDHSWFVVLAGPKGDRPRYAVAVVVDYGGSGGKVSGPICNQIVHALKVEGYL